MGEGERAIAEGRVFVGKKRALSIDVALRVGDEVRVGAAEREDRVEIPIVFERSGVVACLKPAGIPTVPDHAGSSHALVAIVAKQIGRRTDDLRITSRLDREVSGVVMFALDAAAEERLKSARARGAYERRYLALVSIESIDVDRCRGMWDAPIGKGRDPRHRAANGPEATPAVTRYRAVAATARAALLAVAPETGRTHQIRVHASHAKLPLLGDRDYGGPTRLTLAGGRSVSLARIALHCARVAIEDLVAEAPIPEELSKLWSALGGEAGAWDTARTCEVPG